MSSKNYILYFRNKAKKKKIYGNTVIDFFNDSLMPH